jgi:hypothetical protein
MTYFESDSEEYFSRLRRAEIGIHNHIAGGYLLRSAQESSRGKITAASAMAAADRPTLPLMSEEAGFSGRLILVGCT